MQYPSKSPDINSASKRELMESYKVIYVFVN